MSLSVEGQAGPRNVGDGAKTELRLDRTAALVSANVHGLYREATGRGSVFAAANGTPGVAPGTALTTSPPFILWNPPNSGVNLSVLRVRMAYVSGTLGVGALTYSYVSGQVLKPSGGAALNVQSTKLSGSNGVGQAFQGATLTTAPTLLLPAGTIQPVTAATAGVPLFIAQDDVQGEIEVPPGAAFCVQEVGAAGTAPLVMFGVTWEEIPV